MPITSDSAISVNGGAGYTFANAGILRKLAGAGTLSMVGIAEEEAARIIAWHQCLSDEAGNEAETDAVFEDAERVGEIGLRRALGAARRHIAAQFLVESAVMGLLGGIVGASLGILVVVAVSASRTWTPVLDPWVPLAAPLAGALIGLLSGAYPSLRAAVMEPVDALRSGTS